ncbi:hypothetical protein FACS1894217_06200 [Clostridia bacterium]|nr:hypothetical protein FACS1894217_06200 [Clostridia bacterium]
MNAEFFSALDDLEKEKGIPKDYMREKINQALIAAYKKDQSLSDVGDNVVVSWDEKRKSIKIFVHKIVTHVDEIENDDTEITLEDALDIDPNYKLGDIVSFEVDAARFGRIAAQTAKQVIIQGIREAERGMVFDEFSGKEHEVLSGVVTRVDPRGGALVSLGKGDKNETMLGAEGQIPGERLKEGERIKVYVTEVRRQQRGPQVMLSRTHPGFVKRLFETEVPEITDGTVEIRNVAREAGSRTKMAVWSNDPNVDPIGACVGKRGERVAGVVAELRGEKIDIVRFSENSAEFVSAALAPAMVIRVDIVEPDKSCRVIVPFDQLSLAIGKEGQNARLAAKLTGMKIDIKSDA